MPLKLTDTQAYDLLFKARRALGDQEAETVRAATALTAARRALDALQLALVMAQEAQADAISCVISPSEPAPRS